MPLSDETLRAIEDGSRVLEVPFGMIEDMARELLALREDLATSRARAKHMKKLRDEARALVADTPETVERVARAIFGDLRTRRDLVAQTFDDLSASHQDDARAAARAALAALRGDADQNASATG